MRKWKNDFKETSNNNYETYYDIFEDFDALESSFAQQYGIRIRKEINTMSYGEFSAYVSGLNADTAIGNLARIRSETNPEVIKKFNKYEKQIRSEWISKHTKSISKQEYDHAMANLEKIFISMGKEEKS